MQINSSEGVSEKGAIALRSSSDRVDEAFYDAFPNLRPMSKEDRARKDAERESRIRAEQEAEQAKYDAMTDKQKAAYDAKKLREHERSVREYDAYQARHRPDPSGWANGHRAAQSADLTGGSHRVKKTNANQLA